MAEAHIAAPGLVHVNDAGPGLSRRRHGRGFAYYTADGKHVADASTLERIRRLAIPPAWQDVWICPRANGHLQATGRDSRGRKQYRYHPQWRLWRDQGKYRQLLAFGRTLPQLRAQAEHDLAQPGLPRDKVLAALVQLLDQTQMRIGNSYYANTNQSYGLSTLRDDHARIRGQELQLLFRGKSGVQHHISMHDARLARVVQRCRDLPGQELFQYVDGTGLVRAVSSADVNDYLRRTTGMECSAKDFRTWHGSLLAARALLAEPEARTAQQLRQQQAHAIDTVAAALGNTRSICRKCYIHPQLLQLHAEGRLQQALGVHSADQLTEQHVLLWLEQLAAARPPARSSRSPAL